MESAFNYEYLDTETQDFVRKKTSEIKLLIKSVGLKPKLTERYRIGEKFVEVRSAFKKDSKRQFSTWHKNEILKQFNISLPNTYDYIYLYNYTSKYLGGIAGLNDRSAYTALCSLGWPSTPEEIKQRFADIAKSGQPISISAVKRAIEERQATVKSVDEDLEFGSDNCPADETLNLSTDRTHTKVQGMLAKLGRQLCDFVWIARDNHSQSWENETFGDLSINNLPRIGHDPTEAKIIPYIDVIWLGKNQRFKAVFEIECTTSIYSGLLRMTDLMELYGSLNFSFYIVVPRSRVKQVKEQLLRPTFQTLEIDKKCKWIVIEELEEKWENMMNWSSDSKIIDKIAYSLSDK